jgi:hypothetical protein
VPVLLFDDELIGPSKAMIATRAEGLLASDEGE